MYEVKGKLLVVDRGDANELFNRLGCVNVEAWDAGPMVHRLYRAPAFLDDSEAGDLKPLLDLIKKHKTNLEIVLRNDTSSTVPPISILEKEIRRKIGKKRTRSRKKRKRGPLFSFEACHIPPGATLTLKRDPSITCTVIGDPWMVDFGDGVAASFTSRTRELLDVKESTYLSPMDYWCYKDKLLKYYYREFQNPPETKEEEQHDEGTEQQGDQGELSVEEIPGT